MSEADKMFKELGYEKEKREYAEVFILIQDTTQQIGFNKEAECIYVDRNYIKMQELKAINKKVEELGWS